jgi:hypothetical protein
VISGRYGRVAVLLGLIAWAGLAGCGPKPKALRTEPPQPEIQAQPMETDAASKPMAGGEEDASADANAAKATDADAAAKSYLIHKVRWGHETLYSISTWYTGKGHYWERIAAENPEIQPRRMRVGDTIRIPEALLIRRLPMPETFMNPATAHEPKKSSTPKPSTPSQKIDDSAPPLYGPVEQAPPLYGPVGEDAPAPEEKHDELAVPLETLDK